MREQVFLPFGASTTGGVAEVRREPAAAGRLQVRPEALRACDVVQQVSSRLTS